MRDGKEMMEWIKMIWDIGNRAGSLCGNRLELQPSGS